MIPRFYATIHPPRGGYHYSCPCLWLPTISNFHLYHYHYLVIFRGIYLLVFTIIPFWVPSSGSWLDIVSLDTLVIFVASSWFPFGTHRKIIRSKSNLPSSSPLEILEGFYLFLLPDSPWEILGGPSSRHTRYSSLWQHPYCCPYSKHMRWVTFMFHGVFSVPH